jgi:alginate O-acetyltransferase complex protein AlgJ
MYDFKQLAFIKVPCLLIIGAFLYMIYAPLIMTDFSTQTVWSSTEKRRLAELPALDLKPGTLATFPSRFEAYFNDHFGYRNLFIRRYNRIMKKYFAKSPVPNVLIGRNNWLFFTESNLIDDFVGADPFTQSELEIWRSNLEHKRNWLAKQGIRYLFVVAPNKQTIYPEYLPDYLQKDRGQSRLQQLVAYLNTHSDVSILDLSAALNEEKKRHRIYHMTDTHWNNRGAYAAYRAIMERVEQLFPEASLPQSKIIETKIIPGAGGDLAGMLDMADTMQEERPVLKMQPTTCSPKIKQALADFWKISDAQTRRNTPLMTKCDTSKLRAVVFRDSFFEALIPFVSEDFNRIVYIWKPYDHAIMKELIAQQKPQIVIEEMVERLLILVRERSGRDDTIAADPTAASMQH